MTTEPVSTAEAETAETPPRPPGTRIVVAQDSAGMTIMVPPRMGWFVLLSFIHSGLLFFVALLFSGWFAWDRFQAGCFPVSTRDWLPLFLAASQAFLGLLVPLPGVMFLSRRVYLSVQGDEFEVRWTNLGWEGRRRWPRSKVGCIYVDTQFRTACIWIQVVGVYQVAFNNATLPEWEWVAGLLRQALKQPEAQAPTGTPVGEAIVDEIIASATQVRRS
jgi:hypothetical protein